MQIKQWLLILFSVSLFTTQAQQKNLTDDQYFKNDLKDLVQPLPRTGKWVSNNELIIIDGATSSVLNAVTGTKKPYINAPAEMNPSETPEVYKKKNDLYIKKDGQEIQLTHDEEDETNVTASPDGRYVAYTKKNNLYTIDLATKKENKLTQDGTDLILNGYASWVYMEEILGRRSRYRAFWWSPDSKAIAFFRSDDTQVPEFVITDANGLHGYVEKMRYPKVGDPNPKIKIGIVSPDGETKTWADFNENDDQYFGQPVWLPNSSELLVNWMNRKQNILNTYAVNPLNGSKRLYMHEEQKTWIDLDGASDRIRFLQNGKGFLYESDVTGWNHIYYYDMSGKLKNAVTAGKFTVTDINYVDEKRGIVYFTARGIENTARHDLYSIQLNGKQLKRITFGDYNHTIVSQSPDGSFFVTQYNNATTPTRLALLNNKGKLIKELGNSATSNFNNYALAKTEIIRVKSDDGLYDLPMKITWPLRMEKSKKYPVLISIYGGPNAGTVWDSWSLNGTQQFYAKEGLIQVSMDHRASGQFGKEGVNYMYHNLGDWELRDYSTMVKWLIANGQADPSKICITGFSYGGYMTCLALTKYADVFTHGMAGGSVTDWSLYDSHYTERYMGTHEDNEAGYKTGNVMNYADKYKGKLQIVHGMIDENVHMQNSVQLISKLQDLKKDFEMMFYSGGRHGWGGNKQLHFQNLKTRFIYKNLLEKDPPAGMLK